MSAIVHFFCARGSQYRFMSKNYHVNHSCILLFCFWPHHLSLHLLPLYDKHKFCSNSSNCLLHFKRGGWLHFQYFYHRTCAAEHYFLHVHISHRHIVLHIISDIISIEQPRSCCEAKLPSHHHFDISSIKCKR
jgi:hypothetical protein